MDRLINFFKKYIFRKKLFLPILPIILVYSAYSFLNKKSYAFNFLLKRDDSIYYYNRAIDANSKNINAYLKLSKIYNNKKQYTKSITLLQHAIDSKIKNSKIYTQLGISYYLNEQPYLAEKTLKLSMSINSNQYLSYYYLAKINQSFLRYHKSIIYYRASIKRKHNFANAYIGLSNVYKEVGSYYYSKKYLKKAIRLKPNSAYLHTQLASLYIDLREYKSAKKELLIARRKDKNYYKIYYELGRLHYKKGHYAIAKNYLKQATKRNPKCSDAFYLLGKIYEIKSEKKSLLSANL